MAVKITSNYENFIQQNETNGDYEKTLLSLLGASIEE